MKVAFVTPELQALVRRTNLAEFSQQLPTTMRQEGADVRVFIPWFKDLESGQLSNLHQAGNVLVHDGPERVVVAVHEGLLGKLPVVLIDHPELFRNRHPYGDENGPYEDNWHRYAVFARAVLEALELLSFPADVIHCVDWTTGLIPILQQLEYTDKRPEHAAAKAGTYFNIHNLAMQGSFEREVLPKIGLPHSYFRAIDGFELGGRLNFLKAGAEFATIIGAHSPSLARQIQEIDRGDGLEETFRRRQKEIVGVLGGIDYRTWNPTNDSLLAANFSAEDDEPTGKRRCKAHIQAALKLDNGPRTPLLTIIGRFDSDSGFDILAEALTPMLERNIELVLMGPGQTEVMERLRTVEETFAGRCRIIDPYQVGLAHQLLAGSDILLLPGHHHPSNALCAIAMRYGVVPVVYAHSGLEDTVIDVVQNAKDGGGFTFPNYTSDSLLEGVDVARAFYKKASDWKDLVKRNLQLDFSWQSSASNYLKAYRRVTRRMRSRKE